MNLVYFTAGNKSENHLQAAFSITSFLAFTTQIDTINIVTDMPLKYQYFGDKVNIIEVSTALLQEWKGEHNFFWRIKIKAILEVCKLYPNKPILYVDTDTFCLKNTHFSDMYLKAAMYINEGSFAKKKSKTEKKMWQQMNGRTFGGVTINTSHCMWNAGVVLTPNTKNLQDIELALAICDDMCNLGVTPRLIEQAALSIALSSHYQMVKVDTHIAHYWSNKDEWNYKISIFFLQSFFEKKLLPDVVNNLKTFPFAEIALSKKVRNTNVRLKKLVDKLYPTVDIGFL